MRTGSGDCWAFALLWSCVCCVVCSCAPAPPDEPVDTRPLRAHAPTPEAGSERNWPYRIRHIVLAPEVVEVVSIYPAPLVFAAHESAAIGQLVAKRSPIDGFGVLGVTVLSDDDHIEEVTEHITAALLPQDPLQAPPSCFWPRHALRFYRGSERVDALLCFTCRRVDLIAHMPPNPPARWTLTLSGHPEPAEYLNDLLRSEGVPLPDSLPASP